MTYRTRKEKRYSKLNTEKKEKVINLKYDYRYMHIGDTTTTSNNNKSKYIINCKCLRIEYDN